MPLEILGPLVIGGITLTVLAVYFSGISKVATLVDDTAVREEFLKDYGDAMIEKTFLTSNNVAGFLTLQQKNAIGLVEVMGDQFLTRLLLPGDVLGLKLAKNRLDVRFDDFTHKKQSYLIQDPKVASLIHDALAGLKLKETPKA